METSINCYWRKAGSCNTPLDKFEKTAFIIASNDPSRIEVINKIKEILKKFSLKPKVAVELEENNNLSAFCDSLCAYIRGSRISIVDLTAPLKECSKSECNSEYEEPSVNVYWEYGYAAGLKRPIILICEEKQADSIPFNILDKQILYYQENTLEEELGRLLKRKLEQPSSSTLSEISKKGIVTLDIGRTTDSLKNMGKGEMVNLIRQTEFHEIFELTVNIMETITQIETQQEAEESEGFYSFIIILLKSNLTDEEFIKIFEVIFNKFLEINDFRMERIHDRMSEFIRKGSVLKLIIENNLVDKLIEIFLASESYYYAGINSRIIYPLNDNLSQDQVIKIIKGSLDNDQILHSFNAKPILKAIIRVHRDKIPFNLWTVLMRKKLDERGISIKREFKQSGMKITYPALRFILSLDNSWKKVQQIIMLKNNIPNFKSIISFRVLEKIPDKEIQEGLKSLRN